MVKVFDFEFKDPVFKSLQWILNGLGGRSSRYGIVTQYFVIKEIVSEDRPFDIAHKGNRYV